MFSKHFYKFLAALFILATIYFVFQNYNILQEFQPAVTFPDFDTSVQSAEDTPLNSIDDLNGAMVRIAEKTNPSVVAIFTSQTVNVRPNPLLQDFFGDQEQQYERQGLGSGVIVSKDGYILTNNHVVEEADTIKVLFYNEKELSAKVVGTDPKTDLAVLHVNAKNLPTINFGDSESLQVGEYVLAIGNPLSQNLVHTVTMGIVSAKGRSQLNVIKHARGQQTYENFIQTDAAINPGNSGGALIDMNGRLVGINTAIASETGGSQGIGLAIPVNLAQTVMNSIIEHGRVIRGYLGISIQNIDPTMADALGLDQTQGILISNVIDGSPADGAGLKEGDVILELNGDPVQNIEIFSTRIASTSPGTDVDLTYLRNGEKKTIDITLDELPNSNDSLF